MKSRIDAVEFNEWIAYYNIEPFDKVREEAMIAQLCLIMASCWGDGKKKMGLEDFMIFSYPNGKETDPNDVGTALETWIQDLRKSKGK